MGNKQLQYTYYLVSQGSKDNQTTKSGQLTIKAPIPQNGQLHSNKSSATADELFECVWPFCEVGA